MQGFFVLFSNMKERSSSSRVRISSRSVLLCLFLSFLFLSALVSSAQELPDDDPDEPTFKYVTPVSTPVPEVDVHSGVLFCG